MAASRFWYDGSRSDSGLHGDGLPLGARMLAIADAFDAITTRQVYRAARTRDEALDELARNAGKQFDPKLVKLFREAQLSLQPELPAQAASRWLKSLDPAVIDARWRTEPAVPAAAGGIAPLFQSKLLENMYDAVAFIDHRLRVIHWNRGAERLTGLTAATMFQSRWAPSLVGMRDEHGKAIGDDDCPVAFALRTGVHWLRRLSITGRRGREISVDAQLVPVVGEDGVTQGLSLLLHDVSPEITLEERCQDLQAQASRDPLTQVANRAEFDRVQLRWLSEHGPGKPPFSLIIADIDLFKRVNDTFGHPAGDVVIQNFADTLRTLCRPGDLVARYGGEEFAVLCHDCDNAAAARRAEEMRAAFAEMKHEPLGSRRVTASFGVTEIQAGDSPETMLRRADRALYEAKDRGRDRVEALGAGADASFFQARIRRQRRRHGGEMLIEQEFLSEAPLEHTLEKLRGFIADHDAQVLEASSHVVALRLGRRRAAAEGGSLDRSVMFLLDLKVSAEAKAGSPGDKAGSPGESDRPPRTHIHVRLRPEKDRERRRAEVAQHGRELLSSFRAYLMLEADESPRGGGLLDQARNLVHAWFDR
jgi:diguanylate cyclase (GGDEF)-like protein